MAQRGAAATKCSSRTNGAGCRNTAVSRRAEHLILRNRSYLRRFSDCEFAQFVSICFSGNERCGHHGAAFGVLHWVTCPGPNMGTGTAFWGPAKPVEGQTRYLTRAAGLLTHRTHPSAGWSVEVAGAPERGDRHDVGYTDQERSTSNFQLSTFNRVTERAHAGPDMGTDTMCIRTGYEVWGQTRSWTGESGCGTQIWGQARCPIY